MEKRLTFVDDVTTSLLLKIARRHCKLVLEHGKLNTSPERRSVIKPKYKL